MKLSKQRASLDVHKFFFQSACGEGVEPVASRSRGCYDFQLVQEQSGQVLAKTGALKAWLNKPVNGQIQVSKLMSSPGMRQLSSAVSLTGQHRGSGRLPRSDRKVKTS